MGALIARFAPRLRDWPWALKLVALLVTTAIVPVFALTLYSDVVLRSEAISEESARNLLRARNTAALLDEHLQDVMADVRIVARAAPTGDVLAGVRDRERRQELQDLLRQVADTKDLPVLLVLDSTGHVVAATHRTFVGESRRNAEFFLSALAGKSGVQDPRFLPQERGIYLHASVPVRDVWQHVIGVVAARIPLEDIDRVIAADTNFGGRGEFGLLWDERGIAISSPASPGWRFRPLGTITKATRDDLVADERYGPDTARLLESSGPAGALVQDRHDRSRDPVKRTDLGEGLLQVASVPIPDRGWTYAIAAREQDVLLQARKQSYRNVLAALLTALVAVGLAIVSASWLSRPLDQIRDTATALASGGMSRRARLDRRDEIGQMAHAFDSMADELARKDAELRLHADSLERHVSERTAELSGLLAAIPDLLFKVGRDGRFLDYSAPPGEEPALPPENFLGRRLTDVLPPDVSLPALSVVERVLAGETVPPFEYRLQVGRELRHFEARGSLSSGDSVVFLVRNVTDRRHHEERLRFLTRAGSTLTATLDYTNILETLAQLPVPFMADVCVVDLLEAGAVRCAAVSAATPELEALVRVQRLERPVDPASDDPVAIAIRRGVAHFQASSTPQSAGAPASAPASILVLPLIARGQTLGAMSLAMTSPGRRYSESDFAVAQELTHRAGIALDNARLYRDVQEASRLKDEFLGIVSHELRTPLNAVLGWSQVLRRAPADVEQTRRAALVIERNAQAQVRLVEDLLDTSRVISGKIRLEPSPVEVRRLVAGVVESFGPSARTAGLELSASIDEDAGAIRADGSRLQQVLGNLLSNSIKFTLPGGRIEIAVRRVGASLEFVVSDSGAGITADFLPHVFDRFRQADSTTTRAHGGLGIGLAIARHLVELHGGTISASSDGPGCGSTFTIVLPAMDVSGLEEASPLPAGRPSTSRLKGARVLLVDESLQSLEMIRAVLSGAGALVSIACSVSHGRQQIERVRPDLLVVHIGMSGQDGYTLIRHVRRLEEHTGAPRLPAVALTRYAIGDDRLRLLAAGYDVHLAKPTEPAVLVEALNTLLDPAREPAAREAVR